MLIDRICGSVSPGYFLAYFVEILMFPSLTAYMLTSFGYSLLIFNNIPKVVNLEPVILEIQPAHL
jgi:hypothetical protein